MNDESDGAQEADMIRITEGGRKFVAKDEATGIASQGDSKAESLRNLAEALDLYEEAETNEQDLEPSEAPWL